MSQKAAIRRRRQMANGYKHLAPLRRPHYAGTSLEKSKKQNERYAKNKAKGII